MQSSSPQRRCLPPTRYEGLLRGRPDPRGYGYSKEYPVEKRFRDAKIYQIFEGTNEIQKMVISKDITKEMLPKKA